MTVLLAFGDLHVGKGRQLYPARLAEQEDTLRQILRTARDHQVDAVLNLGDTWDRRSPSPDEVTAVLRPLAEHQAAGGPPVLSILGNHCRAGVADTSMPQAVALGGLMQVYHRPGLAYVGNVALAMLPWTPVSRLAAAHDQDRDLVYQDAAELLIATARELRQKVAGTMLLLAHYAVTGASLPSGMPVDQLREVVLDRHELEQIGFSHIILGHIHRPGQFGDGTCLYVGSPLPLDHSETGEHGCWLIDTAARETRFVPVGSRPFVTVGLDLDGHVDGAVVRVKDTVPAGANVDTGSLRGQLHARGAHHVSFALTWQPQERPDREPIIDLETDPAELLRAYLDGRDDTDRLVDLARPYLAGDRQQVPA